MIRHKSKASWRFGVLGGIPGFSWMMDADSNVIDKNSLKLIDFWLCSAFWTFSLLMRLCCCKLVRLRVRDNFSHRFSRRKKFHDYVRATKIVVSAIVVSFPCAAIAIPLKTTSLEVINDSEPTLTPLEHLEAIALLLGLVIGTVAAFANAFQAYVAYLEYARTDSDEEERT